MRSRLKRRLGVTVSVGTAPSKLLARLIGPLSKPDGAAVIPAAAAAAFLQAQPVRSIPHLRGKLGLQLESQLGVRLAGDLLRVPQAELARRFPGAAGKRLAWLAAACSGATFPPASIFSNVDWEEFEAVRERGPQQRFLAEKSFPPVTSAAGVSLRRVAEPTCF